ncbi:DUF1254 domain-containing protein [Variovorax sp. Sphag1AA]|uniref:DUF1254 domain-containing protein n=1 Tax=Variovorax sp. Sphag1AA TaxID=2587027 RepID=UPI0017F3A790|nr:DUF1254 domain-containing protein [Variovorax sp. Sphag1AA]MBB3179287.1 hypothetical protein [Variovorax sp. Sphag1AA]
MKRSTLIAISSLGVLTLFAQQHAPASAAESSGSAANLTRPSPDMAMSLEYAKVLAAQAYVWGWPLVNMVNRFSTITQAPQPGLMNGVLPVAPAGRLAMLHDYIDPSETFVTCPNQDVSYGLAYFDLSKQPVILQVPDFGKRFWVYAIYDHRTDQIGQLGKPYGSKPGFYLLVGPHWKGKVPQGINGVIHSSTAIANVIPRVFVDDTPEDKAAVQPVLNKINVYPLTEFNGKVKEMDWAKLPTFSGGAKSEGETRWVQPEKFFDQFETVLDQVPPLPGEEAMYANFRALIDIRKKDDAIRKAMDEVAQQTEDTAIKSMFRWSVNGKPAGNGWNRSLHNAEWGIDHYQRTSTARSNMFDNRPTETQYFYTDNDESNAQLDGKSQYTVTFPKGQTPPVKGFWSLTLYNEHHLFAPNDLKRYSLGTKSKSLKYNDDGSLTLYIGHASPGKDKESNWLPAPDGTFSLYIRAYWGEKPIIDGSWKPPVIKKAV